MKAIVAGRYGPPEVLEYKDVDTPVPAENQVLLKVYAASVNPVDYHQFEGGLAAFIGWLRRTPPDPRLGTDVAGRVEAVGSAVTRFKPGDEVFGAGAGSFAEYTLGREANLVSKPANCSFEEAAAVPVAAITALQGLRDAGRLKAGETVLVNGASGGVGSSAVQIAKSYGAHVTGVCSTRNLDLVRSLGADEVIDYTGQDFTRAGRRYDLIYDAVGNHSVFDFGRVLNPGGRCVVTGFGGLPALVQLLLLSGLASRLAGRAIGFQGIAKFNQPDLEFLAGLLAAGKIRPSIEKTYPLAETAEAFRHLATGRTRGKLVIRVAEPAGAPASTAD